jgi:hypothetical protein
MDPCPEDGSEEMEAAISESAYDGPHCGSAGPVCAPGSLLGGLARPPVL